MSTTPRPLEIPYKSWVLGEAERHGLCPQAIYNRVARGKYPTLRRRVVNRRVIFVQMEAKAS